MAAQERISLPGVADEVNDTVNALLAQLAGKRPGNLLRASYYDGKHAWKDFSPVIPPYYHRLGMVLGWSAKSVDTLARRCNLDGFVWPDGNLDALGSPQLWDANHLAAEVNSGIVAAFIHGVAFLVTTPGHTGEPGALVHAYDALTATGTYDERSRAIRNLITTDRYDDDGRLAAFTLYLPGRTITAQRDGGRWGADESRHAYGVPVEPLIYKPRAGRPLGAPRISRTVMSLHDAALRTVIRLEGHMDVYSFPEMWMLGADESVFRDATGAVKPQWQVMLGRIKGIPDDEDAAQPRADVHQFPAASPQPHLDNLKQQAMLFSGETSIPLTSLGVSDMSNPTSADSYVASREDLIAEAEGATDDFSPSLARTWTRALAIAAGHPVPDEWSSIAPKWRSPVYLSRAAQADAGMKQLQAVPWLADTDVGLELLGLDEQQIKRALADKRRADGRAILHALTPPVATTPPSAPQPQAAAPQANAVA